MSTSKQNQPKNASEKVGPTPGPWECVKQSNGGKWAIFGPGTRDIIGHVLDVMPPVVVAANARLVAAAPELFEELEALVEWVERIALPALGDDSDGGACWVASAKAALAKATERTV